MTDDLQPQRAVPLTGTGALSPELVEALEAQGECGVRALNLLAAAEHILATPALPAADEAAQACCRSALESLLKLAGEDFPGPRKATELVVGQAKVVAEARRSGAATESAELEELVNAVDALYEQERDQGGFRIRQINQLVLEQTGREMGAAEQLAAKTSWSAFYRSASGVLHGSQKGGGAQALFDGLVMAVEQLFLALPERAERLRELALTDPPQSEDVAEVTMWTDPRSGEFFFRTATSPGWLTLLPVERVLPETDRWPAMPYVRRLLRADPQGVCDWLSANLPAVEQRGPRAVAVAVGLAGEAGMTTCPLVLKVLRSTDDLGVLLNVAYWARDVEPDARTRQWVRVVEHLLNSDAFAAAEEWECGQLLAALHQTAYPDSAPRRDGPKVTTGVRYALANALGKRLAVSDSVWRSDLVNDLTSPTDDGWPLTDLLVPLLRAVLDLAKTDAQHEVPLDVRWKPVETISPAGQVRQRLLAVHLHEAHPADRLDPGRENAWWQAAVPLAGQLVQHRSPRADVAEFLRHLLQACPAAHRAELEEMLRQGLGPAPSRTEVQEWLRARAEGGKSLPKRWNIVRTLSPVLTGAVLAAWRPMLQALEEFAGPPTPRPEPTMTISTSRESFSGLSVGLFAAQAKADGPAAAARALLSTPLPRGGDDADFAYGGVISDLVTHDPQTWAADPQGVIDAVISPEVQAYYLQALHTAFQEGALVSDQLLEAATKAAFAARPDDDATPGADQLRRAICNLLNQSANQGTNLRDIEAETVPWLTALVQRWSRPRLAAGHDPVVPALSHPGGRALLALLAWGVHREGATGQELPTSLTSVLDAVLDGDPDDQALALIGHCLTELHGRAPRWTDAHAAALYALAEPWRPARTWLTHGTLDNGLLKLLDPAQLQHVVCDTEAHEPRKRVLLALLDTADPLGPPRTFLASLAALGGGEAAVSSILSSLAYASRQWAARPALVERACFLWSEALDARLPAAALKGAGAFAYSTAINDGTWLELMARTTDQTSFLDTAHAIAKRAAEHLGEPRAYRIAAVLLQVPLDVYRTAEVQTAAETLFTASAPDPSAERDALQLALINCGKVEMAFTDRP
ncbi:hypothetical protein OG613_48615 (plasmid) [Streptomyces sp. NBC_00015]|uniref:hypothetical protein n=1 Tax=Streptomyces sp. NBC_00015 TaxID=2903611 RepID=UPI002F91A804